ncbi:hypothetical protein KAI46_13810, partial [bacterium]|nr:hypothetical protein [bacterium]
AGGITIVQKPEDAEAATMPKAALRLMKPDKVLSLSEITSCLSKFLLNHSVDFYECIKGVRS